MLLKYGAAILIGIVFLQSSVYQGKGSVFLNPPGTGVSFEGKFSPNSQFVVGASIWDTIIYPDTQLYVWDLRTVDPNGIPYEAEPFAAYDLSMYTENFFWTHQLAFSPDSTTLAILLQSEILLLDFPELTVQRHLPIDDYFDREPGVWGIGWISWSSDGTLLGAADESNGTFIVWDKRTDEILVRRDSQASSGLSSFTKGWVLGLSDAFLFCTPRLDHCASYPVEGEIIIMDSRNQLVVTSLYDPAAEHSTYILWKQKGDGVFEADTSYFADLPGEPHNFSPDGNYIVTSEFVTEGAGSDYSISRVYNAQTHQLIPHLSDLRNPLWLGDTGYLVSSYTVYLPEDAQFISELPPHSGDDDLWAEAVAHWSHLMDTSSDGKWYLWNLGGPAMVVPIIYSE